MTIRFWINIHYCVQKDVKAHPFKHCILSVTETAGRKKSSNILAFFVAHISLLEFPKKLSDRLTHFVDLMLTQ